MILTIYIIFLGISGLNTVGPALQSIPSTSFQLELRNPTDESKMETCLYNQPGQFIHQNMNYQNTPITHHAHHILNIHNHRSLTNSPISNPGSPGLDMIQEETHQQPSKQDVSVCHPQISVTDVLGSEVTLVASSDTSEDSMDSLDNQRIPKIPSFIISEPCENQPSITRGMTLIFCCIW